MKKYRFQLYVILGGILWGGIGLFSRALLDAGFRPENIVVLRNLGGLLLLTLFFAFADRSVFRIRWKHLPFFFGTGIVSLFLFTLCYFRCQESTSLAVSAILLYTAPAMVVVMSALVFHEKITGRKLFALALAMLGCTFVTGVWSGGLHVTPAGFLYGIGSAFFYALYTIFSTAALRHYKPFTVVVWTFLFAGTASLFVLDVPNMAAGFRQPHTALLALGLVVMATVLPYLFYTRGLEGVEGGQASILASVEPVVASFIGIAVYGEPMSLTVLAGLACILGCIYTLR